MSDQNTNNQNGSNGQGVDLDQVSQDFTQTVRKLHYAWDKMNEYLSENADEIQSELESRFEKMKENFEKHQAEMEKEVKAADEVANDVKPTSFADFWEQLKVKAKEYSAEVEEKVEEQENQFAWENAKQKAEFNLQQANMHFTESLKSLQKAFQAYEKAITKVVNNAVD